MASKSSIINRIYERQVMLKFAKELERQLISNLNKTDANDTGRLARSITTKIHIGSDRHVSSITLEHLSRGIFLDMGVGRGASLDDIGYQKIGRKLLGRKIGQRRAKRWYYKKIYGQTIRLSIIAMDIRGLEASVSILDAFDQIPNASISL